MTIDINDFPFYRDSVLVKRFEEFISINPEGVDVWTDITDPINWTTYNGVYWTGTVWRQTSFEDYIELICGNESLENFFPYSYRFTLNTDKCVYVTLYPETGDPIITQYSSEQEIVVWPDSTIVFKMEYGYGKRIIVSTSYPTYIFPDLLEISKIEYRRIPFQQDFDWTQIWNIDITSLGFSSFAQFFIMDDSLFLIGCGNTAESQYDLYFASFENGSWTNVRIVDTVNEHYPINCPFIYNGRKAVISNGVHNTRLVYQNESLVWQTEDIYTEASEETIANINPFVDTLNNIWGIVNFTTFAKLYKRTPLGVWTSETITGCNKTRGEWDNTKLGTFASDGKVHIAYFNSSNDLEYITNASGSWVNTHIDQEAYTTEAWYHLYQPQIALQGNGYPIILYPTAEKTKLAIFNGATWSIIDFPITISFFVQMIYEAGRLYILADNTRFIVYNIATGLIEKSDFIYPEQRYWDSLFFPPMQNLEKTDFYIPIPYASGKWLIYKRGTGTYQSQNVYWKKIGLDNYILHIDNSGTFILAVDMFTVGYLWLSSNGGDSWRDVTPSQVISRAESVGSSWCDSTATVLVCATIDSRYLYLSTNGGESWTEYNVFTALNLVSITRVYCGLGNGAIIIVAEDAGPNTGRVYRLLSGVWTNITPSPEPINGWTSIDFDTTRQKLVMATGEKLLVSDNQGGTWVDRTPVGLTDAVDVSCDSTGEKIIFRETILYKSSDRGLSWTTNEFAGHPWDDSTVPKGKISKDGTSIFVTLFYGSTLYLSTDFGTTFNELPLPDGVVQEAQAWNSFLIGDGTIPFVNYSSALYRWLGSV